MPNQQLTASKMWPFFEWENFVVQLPSDCKPTLKVFAKEPLAPGFNGELKSLGDLHLIDGCATYVLMDILGSYFHEWCKVQRQELVRTPKPYWFYSEPPVGYGLYGGGPFACICKIEMIGLACVSVFSEPFFIGNNKHKEVIKNLPRPEAAAMEMGRIDLTEVTAETVWARREQHSTGKADRQVQWTSLRPCEGKFYKVRYFDSLAAGFIINSARAYAAYARVCKESNLPKSLRPARLYYGFGQYIVTMDFLDGHREANLSDLGDGSMILRTALEAVLWLASHDLYYSDFRPPHIMIANAITTGSGPCCLVDYDDMIYSKGFGSSLWPLLKLPHADEASVTWSNEQLVSQFGDVYRRSVEELCRGLCLEKLSGPQYLHDARFLATLHGISCSKIDQDTGRFRTKEANLYHSVAGSVTHRQRQEGVMAAHVVHGAAGDAFIHYSASGSTDVQDTVASSSSLVLKSYNGTKHVWGTKRKRSEFEFD
jgi:hypothetical protein